MEKNIYNEELLFFYEGLFNDYNVALFYEGLDYNDYEDVKKYLKEINKTCNKIKNKIDDLHINFEKNNKKIGYQYYILKRFEEIYSDFENLKKRLQQFYESKDLCEYLKEECSLVHLVYTNNNGYVKFYSDDSFMFLCQFHKEKTQSLGVTNKIGLAHCYGCGVGFNVISYIMKYEKLSYQEAIYLLAEIYLIDIGYNKFEEVDPLVIKYRNSLLSQNYLELLIKANERTLKRKKTIKNKEALEKFEHDFRTIERVRNGEYLEYQKENKDKRLILKIEE